MKGASQLNWACVFRADGNIVVCGLALHCCDAGIFRSAQPVMQLTLAAVVLHNGQRYEQPRR